MNKKDRLSVTDYEQNKNIRFCSLHVLILISAQKLLYQMV